MTLRTSIASISQSGVGLVCETWTCARRASGTATDPRTWNPATFTVQANPTGEAASTAYDPDRQAWQRAQECALRVPDNQPVLSEGDLARSPRGDLWEISGILSRAGGTGSVRYSLRRSKGMRAEPERGSR